MQEIDPERPYGEHIPLTCVNHPHLRWTTKNISHIGARSIFPGSMKMVPYGMWNTFSADEQQSLTDSGYFAECECPLRDLEVVPKP
jgi:hypothetical protein